MAEPVLHEHRLSLDELSLAALSSHATLPAQPILALHGWLDNAASFIPLMQQLSDWPWLALDLPGHGRSDHRGAGSSYHFVDYCDELWQLTQQFAQPLTLVGHSLGALVAVAFAASFPERVQQLILIEGLMPLGFPAQRAPDILRSAVRSRAKWRARQPSCYTTLEQAIAARRLAGELSQQGARLLVERNLNATPAGWQWRYDQRLRTLSPLRMSESQALAFADGVQCPVTLLYGERGFPALKHALASGDIRYPMFQSFRLPGGHHLHLDEPQACADCLRENVNLMNNNN